MTRYPAAFIIGTVIITAAASTGFIVLEEEKDGLKLWQPKDSDFVKNTEWIRDTFPSKTRFSSILILADNVLDPVVVKETYSILKDIQNIKNGSDVSIWDNKCTKTPFQKCMELSILEAFKTSSFDYDESKINSLSTVKEVTDAIAARAGAVGMPFNPSDYLGSVTYDADGETITGAKAMLLNLMGKNEGDQEGDEVVRDFEEKLIKLVNEKELPGSMVAYPLTMRSFGDLIGGNIKSDLNTLAAGYLLIFAYVLVNLGKLNSVEQRVWLSVAGIVAVMMGVATSFGLSAHMGVFYSGMNQLLPFLMLGVGIDDMFVIMQAFENLTEEEREQELGVRFGRTMRHAGVAITITSVTDLLAFAIGATTVLPALSGFCIYASLGIFFIYFYAITFFLAWFSYDQRRVEDTRDGCICCWKKTDWSPNQCSQRSLMKIAFEYIAEVVVQLPAKIAVILVTLGILAGGIYGAVTLDTYFDYNTFIDEGTYLRNYLEFKEIHFPAEGQASTVYFTDLDYASDMDKIGNLLEDMKQLSSPEKNNISPGSIKFWFTDFVKFVNSKRGANTLPSSNTYTNASFLEDLSAFLGNPNLGGTYRNDFKYSKEIDYSKPAPKVLLSSMSYKHPTFEHSNDGVVAMKEVFSVIDKYQFSGNVFATSEAYGSYLTVDIITEELYRNMAMALGVVLFCTLILIADFATSFIVLITVTLTIVNVAGYANFWGLSIDTLFAIFMTISIGLCVDYSAHIAHAFMVEEGTRDERMMKTLINIGPAVLNGGISTFLAFVLLCMSKSIIFLTFFKIFFLVVVFGLFHGLLFLPVVLSLIGPQSHGHLEDNMVTEGSWRKVMEKGEVNPNMVEAVEKGESNPAFEAEDEMNRSKPQIRSVSGGSRPLTSLPGSAEDTDDQDSGLSSQPPSAGPSPSSQGTSALPVVDQP